MENKFHQIKFRTSSNKHKTAAAREVKQDRTKARLQWIALFRICLGPFRTRSNKEAEQGFWRASNKVLEQSSNEQARTSLEQASNKRSNKDRTRCSNKLLEQGFRTRSRTRFEQGSRTSTNKVRTKNSFSITYSTYIYIYLYKCTSLYFQLHSH